MYCIYMRIVYCVLYVRAYLYLCMLYYILGTYYNTYFPISVIYLLVGIYIIPNKAQCTEKKLILEEVKMWNSIDFVLRKYMRYYIIISS